MSAVCYLCGGASVSTLLDVGPHPITNRFLTDRSAPEPEFSITLAQCQRCGLIQVPHPVPAVELVPRYDWITYSEPEGHLDTLVDRLMALPGVGPGATVGGVSFKDDSTLDRLAKRGLGAWRLDLREDLGVRDPRPGLGVETIQDRLTPEAAAAVAARRGPADVLIVRHILEHAYDPTAFLDALATLTTPDGYIVVEVPDCSGAIERADYTTVWEEHTLYFTPETLRHGLLIHGFSLARFDVHPYPFENSLVAVVRRRDPVGERAWPPDAVVAAERERGRRFAEVFLQRRDRVRAVLSDHRRRGRIALFGAGHLACTYMTVFGVADLIDCVIDDNPHKRGLYMPGSRLPIVGSSALADRDITLCLLGLNPLGEDKVVERHRAFVERGGRFASIFPGSARALPL